LGRIGFDLRQRGRKRAHAHPARDLIQVICGHREATKGGGCKRRSRMIGSLSNAFEALKETLQQPGVFPVLEKAALEDRFHGLNVSQVAKLVDAPALGMVEHRNGGGVTEHRLLIDGRDSNAKQALLEQAVFERPGPRRVNEVQEFVLLDGGAVQNTLVRDHNDVAYTLREGRAEIDRGLTDALRAPPRRT
jgi:hypothetical protein